jgi:hypothetical protein
MRIPFVASSAAFLLTACASSKPPGPPPLEVYSTGVPGEAAAVRSRKMTATVLAVDTAARRLTLKDEDGKTETINVPPEVKRFNEIAAGDTIDVEVQEGLLFEYQPAGSAFVAPVAVVAGERARASQPPGAAALAAVQSTVTVTAIDLESRIVQFQDPDGNKYQVKAGPELSIDKLVVGDRLLATYATTLAIAVNKKP